MLTTREAQFTRRVLASLAEVEWAKPLLRRIAATGGIVPEAMPLLFEARYAYCLHRSGIVAEYEYRAGVGDSTVEFRILGARDWLVELVSIRESNAAKSAVRQHGPISTQMLRTPDPGAPRASAEQSSEAQMIKVEEKIGEKVFADGRPTKFPTPGDAIHAILVDMRGYLPSSDDTDYMQIAYGQSGVLNQDQVMWWEDTPIAGLFEVTNPTRAARLIRERIHFLGFICECEYVEGELPDKILWLHNPNLVPRSQVGEVASTLLPRQAP
jgi:hypothetical protein